MRMNSTKQACDLISYVGTSNYKLKHETVMDIGISKTQLWYYFKQTFESTYNKKLICGSNVVENLKVLFLYFLRDNDFFNCKNLRDDVSKPSFSKGLLIIGGYGLGKSAYLKIFETIFLNFSTLKFKFYSSKELVRNYEKCIKPLDKEMFLQETERKKIFIDDINSERLASNYGKVDVVNEILFNRYDKNLKTFAACNYTTDNRCAKQTLLDLGLRYGGRMYDRYHEMFNIIEFHGKSFR